MAYNKWVIKKYSDSTATEGRESISNKGALSSCQITEIMFVDLKQSASFIPSNLELNQPDSTLILIVKNIVYTTEDK